MFEVSFSLFLCGKELKDIIFLQNFKLILENDAHIPWFYFDLQSLSNFKFMWIRHNTKSYDEQIILGRFTTLLSVFVGAKITNTVMCALLIVGEHVRLPFVYFLKLARGYLVPS